MQRMEISPFVIEEEARERARSAAPKAGRRRRRPAFSPPDKKTSQTLIKIGICTAACALILGMKALNLPGAQQVVSGVRVAINKETDLDKMLGKLQFVELPNALEVFSGESKLAVPVNAPNASIEPLEKYAVWKDAPDAEVVAAAAGEVRAVGEDNVLGKYVRIQHAGDLETIYYGLAEIQVEQGQPIRRQDTLGRLGEDGVLRLCVLLSGEPQPPDSYLDLVLEG